MTFVSRVDAKPARAYAELQEEGWLTCETRRGTHVATNVTANDKQARKRDLQETVARFRATLAHHGYSELEISTVLRRFVK